LGAHELYGGSLSSDSYFGQASIFGSESWQHNGSSCQGSRSVLFPWGYTTHLQISIGSGYVVSVRHAGVNSKSDLDWVMTKVFEYLADVRTPYLNEDEHQQSVLMTVKFLCDLKERVDQLFDDYQTDGAKDLFCQPWLVKRGLGTHLLKIEKDVSVGRCMWATITAPLIPFSIFGHGLDLMFLGHSSSRALPATKVAFRYTVFGGLEDWHEVHLDSEYTVQQRESMVAAVACMGTGLSGFVRAVAAAHGVIAPNP